MLDEIFNEYAPKKNNEEEEDNEDNIENKEDEFLNPSESIPVKNKSHQLLEKYCTLYNKEECIKPLNIQKINKKIRQEEMGNTTGPMWFNMKAPNMTPELKNELKALQLRSYIDPFNFKKKNDKDKLEKYFQIGTIQDNIVDGKKNRLKKSEVKNSILEEMLDFDKQKNFSLRKFKEYQEKNRKIGLNKAKLNKYKLKTKGKTKGVVTK
ncbi:MAG: Fcf2 domain-containing protein [archaeon]|nr:Fcf2 domain-containing protein [archaeon]